MIVIIIVQGVILLLKEIFFYRQAPVVSNVKTNLMCGNKIANPIRKLNINES